MKDDYAIAGMVALLIVGIVGGNYLSSSSLRPELTAAQTELTAVQTELTEANDILDEYDRYLPDPPVYQNVLINDTEKTVLIINDMQIRWCQEGERSFIQPFEGFSKIKYEHPDFVMADAVSTVKALLDRTRAAGIDVVYIAWTDTSLGEPPDIFDNNITPELAPLPGEFIFWKFEDPSPYGPPGGTFMRFNAFLDTNLSDILLEKGYETVIFTGGVSNACVYHATVHIACEGFQVIMPADCTAARSWYEQDLTEFQTDRIGSYIPPRWILSSSELITLPGEG